MIKTQENKSVITTFTRRVFIIIFVSALSIGLLIIYFSYDEFTRHSKDLEKEYIQSKKEILKYEVSNVEGIINYSRSKLDHTIRSNIKSRVYDAHSVATHLYQKYKNSKSKNEIINLIKEALRPLRFFDGRGYIFITNLSGKGILHPTATRFEGASVLNLKNKKGVSFAKDILNLTKEKGEGFYSYDWTKPNEKGQFTKISFVKHFKPYNWTIGTGDYLIEVERNIQKEVLERIGEIQFDKEGDIFVVNYDGYVMMNRGNRSLIGKNILDVTDSNGVRVAEEVIKLAQTPGWDGYFKYTWQKLSSSKVSPKMAYHKTVPDWGWYYGTGVYLDDVNKVITKQKSKLKNHLFFNLFLISTTLLFAIYIIFHLAQKNSKYLQSDLNHLFDFFKKVATKPKPLISNNMIFSEFKQLSDSANMMLEKQKISAEQNVKLEQQLQQTQKMEVVTQMVGGIAHDFNNLLGVILGFGEMLESKLRSDPKLEKYCREINTAGARGAKLTRKLLSLTRQQTTEAESCNVNNLLEEEKSFLKKSLTAKINLEFNLNENIWRVWIDRSDFEDVILNLCVNSMHAMKESQQDSCISITTDNIKIDGDSQNIANLKFGDYVKLSITDNGMGMSDEIKERVFEPFYTTRETGTGLGLSQAYSFSIRSEGAVFVESTIGEGTTFIFLIPRCIDTTTNNTATNKSKMLQNEAPSNLKGKEVILVVDDEPALRELTNDILTEQGYLVLQAADGIDALGVLESAQVDLVISDVIMPNMDGNLLSEKIKRLYPNIKIQLLSGYTHDEQRSEINHDLHDELLHKPIDSISLLKRIRELLDQA